jgi:hypothetical protein
VPAASGRSIVVDAMPIEGPVPNRETGAPSPSGMSSRDPAKPAGVAWSGATESSSSALDNFLLFGHRCTPALAFSCRNRTNNRSPLRPALRLRDTMRVMRRRGGPRAPAHAATAGRRPHAARQRHQRQEATQAGMAVGAQFPLWRARQSIRSSHAVEGCRQQAHRSRRRFILACLACGLRICAGGSEPRT